MTAPWSDPPLEQRRGIPDLDFAIAYISETDDGKESCGIIRRKSLQEARSAALGLVETGHQVRVYDKEGTPT
jgi:hypothetical protein